MDGSKSEETMKLIKWAGLVAAIWVQAFAGNTFAYANYSATLKSELELNQVELNYLALSKDFGENVGLLAGILCNHVPPWVILFIAALEGLLGFGSLWLVASKTIASRPLWQVLCPFFPPFLSLFLCLDRRFSVYVFLYVDLLFSFRMGFYAHSLRVAFHRNLDRNKGR